VWASWAGDGVRADRAAGCTCRTGRSPRCATEVSSFDVPAGGPRASPQGYRCCLASALPGRSSRRPRTAILSRTAPSSRPGVLRRVKGRMPRHGRPGRPEDLPAATSCSATAGGRESAPTTRRSRSGGRPDRVLEQVWGGTYPATSRTARCPRCRPGPGERLDHPGRSGTSGKRCAARKWRELAESKSGLSSASDTSRRPPAVVHPDPRPGAEQIDQLRTGRRRDRAHPGPHLTRRPETSSHVIPVLQNRAVPHRVPGHLATTFPVTPDRPRALTRTAPTMTLPRRHSRE